VIRQGYGGTGTRHYGDPCAVLAGVLVTDPPAARRPPKPRYVATPFGPFPVTGATVLVCGACQGAVYPRPAGRHVCRCDYRS
jgi:hypothetical protein